MDFPLATILVTCRLTLLKRRDLWTKYGILKSDEVGSWNFLEGDVGGLRVSGFFLGEYCNGGLNVGAFCL